MRHRNMTVLVVASGLLVAACGGDDDTAATGGGGEIVVVADSAEIASEPVGGDGLVVADDSDGAAESAETEEQQALAFAQCMRDEGVDWPDPVTNADGSIDFLGGVGLGRGGGFDDATQDAFAVCGDLLDGASFLPGGGDGFDTETQDTFVEFAQCLREQGLDVDDPDLSGGFPAPGAGGGGGLFGDGFDPQDPANAEALSACQGLFTGVFGN